MKLGAQMYSVRTECQTKEALRNTFLKLKEIGYESAQLSGTYDVDAETAARDVDALVSKFEKMGIIE